VKSVGRAIDILLAFTRSQPSMGIAELQKTVGIARPTLYRMLRTLESRDLIRFVGEPRRYELGFRVMQLANTWLAQAEVTRAAGPLLEELRQSTQETVALSVPCSRNSRVFAIELPSRHAIAFSLGVGHIQAMHVGASGKAILAFLPPTERECILGSVDTRLRKGLDSELAKIREEGFSLTRGEMIPGALAIAAPVFDREGTVIASVSIVGPEGRMQGSDTQRVAQFATDAANKISSALGYADGPPLYRSRRGSKSSKEPGRNRAV